MSRPSLELLELLRKNLRASKPRPLALFSDFDGTLAPIAPTPSEARILPQALDALRQLTRAPATRLLVGILSGRRLSELVEKLPLKGALLAGNHGLEIRTPEAEFVHPQAKVAQPQLARLRAELQRQMERFPGAWIEDKGLGLAVHYRQLELGLATELDDTVAGAAFPFKRIRLMHGRRVWELRPAIDWDKGRALAYMLEVAEAPSETLVVYLGDDVTDEDAFREVNRREGISVLVREEETPTLAKHRLSSPEEVAGFLAQVALLYNGK